MPVTENPENAETTSTEPNGEHGAPLSTEVEPVEWLDGFVGRYTSTVDNGLMFTLILNEIQAERFHELKVRRGTHIAFVVLNDEAQHEETDQG